MERRMVRNSMFVFTYFILFFLWLVYFQENRLLVGAGITLFPILGYSLSIFWLLRSYVRIRDKQRYFWLFFAMGICFLFVSQLVSAYHMTQLGMNGMSLFSVENGIRLGGYHFFFFGFVYQMKMLKRTLPMLRFLLNIVIVIIAIYSISWFFLVNPILESNSQISHSGFFISSFYHVFNISLLFIALCLIRISPSVENKASLFLIAVGFLIQVTGDFFNINQANHGGIWVFLSWPLSVLFMGLGAVYSEEFPSRTSKEVEQLEYKNYGLSLFSVGILLLFTIYRELAETNTLEKGLFLTVFLLILQQWISTIENKSVFSKLKRLATLEDVFSQTSNKEKSDNEITRLIRKIEKLAHYDSLTELPNRTLLHKYLEREIKHAETDKTTFSLLYIDLDRFKNVNDSLGHDCGDLLLQQVATRLKESIGEGNKVARIGGDEFAIIFNGSQFNRIEKAANDILKSFETSFHIHQHEVYTTPSIGISVYPDNGQNSNDLLKNADAAMYLAKEEGKNKYHFFNPGLHEKMLKKIDIETRIRRGLEEDRFILYYQPQVDLRTGRMVGVEALIRLNDPELGMIPPVDFIPIAEETGLIEPLGTWVMKTACQQLIEWQEKGIFGLTMSVNVSMRQFQNPAFVDEVKEILEKTGIEPQYLKIEITESVLPNYNTAAKILNDLKALGIQIAIDDFGTGYSSLSYLKKLPVSYLKIDKAFIDELTSGGDGAIVKTIIDMGRNMNFTIIAEGIESEEHAAFLKENQCFYGQGYLFSKPVPASKIESLFEEDEGLEHGVEMAEIAEEIFL